MKYLSVDGDDVGRKITSCYLQNGASDLKRLSDVMRVSTEQISGMLQELGFDVIFCAADGVLASIDFDQDFGEIFERIGSLAPDGITFSAGVGSSLREAYVALLYAKSSGKDRLCLYESIES